MVQKELQTKIGERIRYLRRDEELTQTALGEKVGVVVSYICDMEKGWRPISTWMLYKLEKELGPIWTDSF